jgi:putative flippase GtrA
VKIDSLQSWVRGRLLYHQIKVRFVLVGTWNTLFGYLVFIGLEALFSSLFASRSAAYMLAMVISNPIAILNAFIFHKYWTFRSAIRGKRMVFEFLRFLSTYAGTFALSLALLPLLVEVFSLTPRVAGAITILICTVISYLGHSRFSFREKPCRAG